MGVAAGTGSGCCDKPSWSCESRLSRSSSRRFPMSAISVSADWAFAMAALPRSSTIHAISAQSSSSPTDRTVPPPSPACGEEGVANSDVDNDDDNSRDKTASGPVRYRVYKRRWIGILVLMMMNIVVSWGWLTFAPVSNHTAEWFKLSSETPVNWLSTVTFFAYIVATPAVVHLLGRYSIKPTLLLASSLVLAGSWIRYGGTKCQSYGATMFGQILMGFSQPFFLNAAPHYSDLWFTQRGRVSATAVVSLSNPIGAALAQLIDPMLATKASDIPNMVLIVAIIATVGSLLWAGFPAHPPSPPSASGSQAKATFRETISAIKCNRNFWIMMTMFSIYVGLFNAFSSLLNQIMMPQGYTADQAGITGALLIVTGLISTAVVSPIVDRTHSYFLAVKICVPIIGACFVAFVFAPKDGMLAGPFAVAAILGGTSFCLMPLALELAVEFTLLWCGGQFIGAVMLLGMDAMKTKNGDMKNALTLQAVLACVVVPGAFLFSEGTRELKRLQVDETASV
ncbi:MFS general substrate transporter [Wilcoxina mikolae CBS 423.85]|nr:MFS general substrate transporter [Wilcoxina mikolae CBS 423.85]